MGMFDRFASKEELLEAVSAEIRSEMAVREDVKEGEEDSAVEVFFLPDESRKALDELNGKYEAEIKNSQGLRKRAQAAEADLKNLRQENARLTAANEEFSKYNPEKQKDEINRLVNEVGRLKADNGALKEQIQPLNALIGDFQRKEDERTIENALIECAAEIGIRPEAMRDVMFRKSMLEVSDIGTVQTRDGVHIRDYLKAEFEKSPLWHPQSQGGGSDPGNAVGELDNAAKYEKAKEANDINGMLSYAPEFKGVTMDV